MHSRNQNKPPITPAHNLSRIPSNKSEVLDDVQLDKRRKIGGGKMVGQAAYTRSRALQTAVNTIPGSRGVVSASESPNGDSTGGQLEFKSREDVEKLLAEKLNPKNRNNDKGRNKELRDNIKKFKACINWYMKLEDGYLAEQEKLRDILESEQRSHSEIETHMSSKIDELTLLNEEHQKHMLSLEESLRKEEADKLAAIEAYEKEAEAKITSENLRSGLLEELERATQEIKHLNDQIKMVQETNKWLQEYNTSLQQYIVKNGDTITKLQKDKTAMMETLSGLRDQSSSLKNQLDAIRSSHQDAIKQREEFRKEVGCLRSELQQVRADRDQQLERVQSMTVELKKYEELYGKSNREMDIARTKASALEETCSSQQDQLKSLHYQLAVANEKLKRADMISIEIVQENETQKKLINELQSHVIDLECQLVEAEKLRKKLHNTILELKGNIRVFCRVRPILPDADCRGTDVTVVSYPTSVEYLERGIDLMHNAQNHSFTFDKVFDQEASQEDVFFEISQLVQSALDGYKVCIFAYGQTGSGKTYTMMGKPEDHKQKGLIPRSLEQIFETSEALKYQGWKYKIQASILEIYNETIRDLLSPSRCSSADATHVNKQYMIKHDSAGNTFVPDLTVVDVCSLNEVSFLLNQAAQSRSVGKTQMNEQSSRSHFVFTLRISGVNDAIEQQVQGILNLIDLAGSERLAKSGSTGARLKETQAINKSLSSLSDVILAIAKKKDHVPYRNSKLTYLLQGRNMELWENIKKFRACVNWYMELEDGYLAELEKLRSMLGSEQRRHSDIEAHMSCKIDELTLLIEEHQKHVASLEKSLRKEEADKLAAIESFEKEAQAKVASENIRCGLLEELEKTTQEIKYLNDQIKMIQEINKRLQEYNISLQQYNNNLQAEAMKNGDAITKLQKDKTAMMETLAGLRDQTSLLKNQLDTIRSSQQEAIKQREEFRNEVNCLRSELQQVRVDRDHQLEHIQRMTVELKKYEELNGKSSRDTDIALTKASTLEETCSSEQDQIKSLHYQLTIANEKLKRADLATIEIVQENEAKKKVS